MKNIVVLAFLGLFFVLTQHDASANGYFLINGGSGGKYNASSLGGEIGVVWPATDLQYFLGFGISQINSETRERYYPAGGGVNPPYVWDKVRSNEQELYAAGGLRLVNDFFLGGSVGASTVCEGTVLKGESASSCDSWDGNKSETNVTWSGQIRYIWKNLIIGGGYHNRRGPVLGIGFNF